jgi:exo-beta-1,3-glucanase (GH17 family)
MKQKEADPARSLANAFSYWQGQDISNATASYFDDIQQAIGHIQEVSGSLDAVHIMNGETGWPTSERLSSLSLTYANCF